MRVKSGLLKMSLAGILALCSSALFAATYTVKADGTGDYPTIQATIDAAVNGDMVLVQQGTYYENISFNGKDIILTSTDPGDPNIVEATIIDGGGIGSVVTFDGDETSGCILQGFTITNGTGTPVNGYLRGGGIFGNYTHASIKQCIIANNTAEHVGGGLYYCFGVISNCMVNNNIADSGGGMYGCSAGTIINCTISSNNAVSSHGGGLSECDGGAIINCIITGNTAGRGGGGCSGCSGSIINCTIVGNYADNGGGYAYPSPGTIVSNCIIWGNSAGNSNDQIYNPFFPSVIPTYSCIQDWTGGGTGNIDINPMFADTTSGNSGDWDLHVLHNSPCIDAGMNSPSGGLPVADMEGFPRLFDGNTDGTVTVDMGVYEYYIYPEEASIFINPPSFFFSAYEAGSNPVEQSMSIQNLGNQALNWSLDLTNQPGWLTVIPTNGSLDRNESETVMLFANINGLSKGQYSYTFEVDDPAANNSPQTIAIDLEVIGPVLEVSENQFSFLALEGGPNPNPETLVIQNSGSGTIQWIIEPNSPGEVIPDWLSVSPVSGQCSAEASEVTLSVDAAGLEVGFYDFELRITDDDASNSPQTVAVFLHVYSNERHVPDQYPTIQQAIDAAVDGDHVIVHPGRYPHSPDGYYESIDFKGKAITVRSIDPTNPEIVASTILDRGYVYFNQEEGRDSVLDGLTINGSVNCYNSSPVIKNCMFGEPMPTPTYSVSISIYQGNPYIQNCTFVGAGSGRNQHAGTAISVDGNRDTAGDTIIENCLLSYKSYDPYLTPSIHIQQGHVDIVNTTIAYCLISPDESYPYLTTGTGLFIQESDVSLENSIVWGNRGSDDTQIAIVNNSPDPDNPLNSHVDVVYSDIEGGSENILIFPDAQAYEDYRYDGILPDPNFVDPNTVTWRPGNIDVDPLFVREPNDGGDGWFINYSNAIDESANNDYGDLHLKSQAGRFVWDGFAKADFNLDKRVDLVDYSDIAQAWGDVLCGVVTLSSQYNLDGDCVIGLGDFALFCDDYLQPRTFGAWVQDDMTSPCIDAGDPNDMGWQNELWPHGGRVNMGAYGGTPQASMSPNPVGNPVDLNHDNAVNLTDWSLWSGDWLAERVLLGSDFDRDNDVDPNDMTIFMDNWLWAE